MYVLVSGGRKLNHRASNALALRIKTHKECKRQTAETHEENVRLSTYL